MAVQSFLRDLDGLFNYSTDENPTSQQDYQEAVKNWVDTIKSLVDCTLWQPDTEYSVGNVLRTPSLPYELQLTCVTAGTSGSAEPDYTDVDAGDIITDGTAEFRVDYSLVEGALASTNDVPSGVTFGSNTLLSKMIANMNTQDGVQYNLSNANSWYICLGAKYGGLIIQGGKGLLVSGLSANAPKAVTGTYSIAFTRNPIVSVTQSSDINLVMISVGNITTTQFTCNYSTYRTDSFGCIGDWIAIGV